MVLVVDTNGAFRREIGRSVRADCRDETELAAVNYCFHVGGQHDLPPDVLIASHVHPTAFTSELIAMLAARGRACCGVISSAVEHRSGGGAVSVDPKLDHVGGAD